MNVIASQDLVLQDQTSFPEQERRVEAEEAGHKTSSGEGGDYFLVQQSFKLRPRYLGNRGVERNPNCGAT